MGGSPGNTIEQRARAPAGRHTSLLCLGTRNSIPPGSHVGAFYPVVPSATQTARVSPLRGWATGSYGLPRASAHGLTHSAPLGLEPGRYPSDSSPPWRALRLLTQSMKTHASARHEPVEVQNDPLPKDANSFHCAL